MEVYFFISVSVHCKDTRIVVNVGTNKPFSGRIYALGRFVAMTSKSILAGKKQELLLNEKNCHNDLSSRSETCNVDVINSDTFRLVVDIVSEFVTPPQLAFIIGMKIAIMKAIIKIIKKRSNSTQSSPDWI